MCLPGSCKLLPTQDCARRAPLAQRRPGSVQQGGTDAFPDTRIPASQFIMQLLPYAVAALTTELLAQHALCCCCFLAARSMAITTTRPDSKTTSSKFFHHPAKTHNPTADSGGMHEQIKWNPARSLSVLYLPASSSRPVSRFLMHILAAWRTHILSTQSMTRPQHGNSLGARNRTGRAYAGGARLQLTFYICRDQAHHARMGPLHADSHYLAHAHAVTWDRRGAWCKC